MNIQDILVFLAFIGAVAFLIKKFFFKKKTQKACGQTDCGC